MADTKTPAERSENMSRIRSTNTKPEEIVRKYLFSHGFRYRKNDKRYPGKPDIVLPKYHTIIFVNGCFWHMHGCSRSRLPRSNQEYWKPKIERNIQRDAENQQKLEADSWKVIVVWECELKLLYRVNPVCVRSARQTARTMEVRAVLRHCVPYKGLHPLRRLCGYPYPLWMGNNLFAQTVSHPKPKTQHANFTACPKDRRYFLSANKGGIYDANNRKTETGDRRRRKEVGAGAQQAPAAGKPKILL